MKQRLEELLDEETFEQDIPGQRHGPFLYYLAQSVGKDLYSRLDAFGKTVGPAVERALWKYVLEPLGGCLSFSLKERIQDSVGEKFHAARATKKSYWLKATLYAGAGIAAALSLTPPDDASTWLALYGGGMLGGLLSLLEWMFRTSASMSRYGHSWPSHEGSDRTRIRRKYENDYDNLSGEPFGIALGWLYTGAERVANGAGGWWSARVEDAERLAAGERKDPR